MTENREPMPAPLSFRTADLADVPAIVALVESAYRGDASRQGWTTEADLLDGRRTDADDVGRLISSTSSLILLGVAESGGIVGCCNVQRRSEGRAYFGLFAVSPARQSAGIGGRLLTAAEDWARREWGARTMRMTVLGQRPDLIAWYARRGYLATGETEEWPHRSATFGIPRRDGLYFVTLEKVIGGAPDWI